MKKLFGAAAVLMLAMGAAHAQDWQQKWRGGFLNRTCYLLPPPSLGKTIGEEAIGMLKYDADPSHTVTKKFLQLQYLMLRCMRAAGAPE